MRRPADGAIADLAFWIGERYNMKLRRDEGVPPPWSADPAMATVRYCNVHREDDRVTRWIAENWRNPNAGHKNLTLAMVLARLVNWPDTLEEIGFPADWDATVYRDRIRARAARGEKTWTAAYIVSTCGQPIPKEDYVCLQVCQAVSQLRWGWRGSDGLEEAHRRLQAIQGLGSFLSAQVVADLKNTPGHPLLNAHDWWTWAAPGPGSLRGLNWFFNGRQDGPATTRNFLELAAECFELVKPYIPEYVPPIHMQDFQNCLCEFSKYMRFRKGNGRVRNRYTAGA